MVKLLIHWLSVLSYWIKIEKKKFFCLKTIQFLLISSLFSSLHKPQKSHLGNHNWKKPQFLSGKTGITFIYFCWDTNGLRVLLWIVLLCCCNRNTQITFADKPHLKITIFQKEKHGFKINTWSDESLKGAVVNPIFQSIKEGHLEVRILSL